MRRTWNCSSLPITGTSEGFGANRILDCAVVVPGAAQAATVAAPMAAPAFRKSRRLLLMVDSSGAGSNGQRMNILDRIASRGTLERHRKAFTGEEGACRHLEPNP